MSKKEKTQEKSVRRWTKEEVEKFAEVLADPDNAFASCLDKLALKKSSNNEVYENIKKVFDQELKKEDFIAINERNNFIEKGKVVRYKKLDTSIVRLRNKFKSLKSDWLKLHTRILRGSGLAPSKEPLWFKHIDPVFSETNADVELTSSYADTSVYAEKEYDEEDEDREHNAQTEMEGDLEQEENYEEEAEQHETGDEEREQNQAVEKRKMVVAPHKKAKQIRSNKQALSEIASGLKAMAESSTKQHQMAMEADERREQRYLEFRREEAEKNRQHELRIAEILAGGRQRQQTNHPKSASSSSVSHTSDENDPYRPQPSLSPRSTEYYNSMQGGSFFPY